MILPPQKLTTAERFARDKVSGKNNIEETIDYYISCCNWGTHTEEILALYRAVEGHLDQEEYRSVQGPQNQQKNDGAPTVYNAVLKDYNILKGIANLLMGEFGRRTHEVVVSSINPSDSIAYKDGLNIIIQNYYSQAVANSMASLGFDLGQQVVELPPIEQYVEEYNNTFDEERIISGQEILDYIKYNVDFDSKLMDLYWDWVITGGFVTYKQVNHDDVTYERVPRDEFYAPIERHSRFIEDYSFGVRRQIMPIYKVVDLFKGRIPEELMDALETEINSGMSFQFGTTRRTGNEGFMFLPSYSNQQGVNTYGMIDNQGGVELYHVQYKTWEPYYILDYIDKFGLEQQMDVGEDYKIDRNNGDIKLTKKYINVLYEGYKVLDFYLDCGKVEEARADLNQEGLVKLEYNGTNERSSTGDIQSIIKEGLTAQRSINVLRYQIEKMANKNKDKIMIMPYGLVPRKKGMDTKTQMYHADATSILWVDETAPNFQVAAQTIKVLDMSMGKFITESIELIRYIKSEYWESIGMNAQRYSDVGQNAGKAVTEQAIVRSAIITYELTRQFDKVVEKDYTGLLDISKLAYITGKKAKYIRSDGSKGFLNMNQDGAMYHTESSYNIFVRDASEMTEATQAIRGQALSLIQNGAPMSVLGKIYETNNTTKLTKLLEKMEANKKEFDMLMQKQKDDAQMAIVAKQNETEAMITDREKYKADMQYQGVVDSASIRTDGQSSRDLPRPANDVERELASHKIQNDNRKIDQEAEKIKIQKEQSKQKQR